MITPDNIPDDVRACAIILEHYFKEQGVEDWALLGVCSRSMYEKTKTRLENEQARVAFCAPWS